MGDLTNLARERRDARLSAPWLTNAATFSDYAAR
jgi:hypothetical protein